jgi:DNA-binding FadR family transcriptional regulator
VSVEFAQILIEPAYRKVAAAIGARILGRTLREGQRLPSETELARQFGVNRSTVREALRELESRGLVQRRPGSKLMSVSRPHRDTVAAGVSDALLLHDVTVRDLWRRHHLRAADQWPRHAHRGDQRIVASIEPSAAARGYRAGGECHGGSVSPHRQATHNPVLQLAQEPRCAAEPSLRVMIGKVPQAPSRIATAHRHLLEALRARDEATAESWMARHIRDFKRGYELAGIDLALRVNAEEPAAV